MLHLRLNIIRLLVLFCFIPLSVLNAKTLKVDTLTPSITNGDLTLQKDGTGDIVLGSGTGVAKLSSGVLSESDVNLTSEVTGILPIANGGTGSSSQNFVDLTTSQSIAGDKTYSGLTTFNGQYVAISTTNGNRPCPVMSAAQRDAISSPAEGDCVVSTDDNQVYFYLNSVWSLTGGSGSGGINYLDGENSTAEATAGDWAAYADAAGVLPVDGTGGSATVTIARNTTTPLRGDGDFVLTKDASNRQGEGASVAFMIDKADQGKTLRISFDYTTSTNYVDDDVQIFVYDVTNSNLIRGNGELLKGITGNSTHYYQFQAASDSTSYRLVVHVASTNASAYTINFDNVRVSPAPLVYGVPATDEIDIASDISFSAFGGSETIDLAVYRRVGRTAHIEIQVTLGATPSGGMQIILPSYLPIDRDEALLFKPGSVSARDTSTGGLHEGSVLISDTDTLEFRGDDGSGGWNATIPFTWASGDTIFIEVTVPIQGWSSNARISEDLGGREVVLQASRSGSNQTVGTSETDIIFNNGITDDLSILNTTTGIVTLPESGFYDVSSILRVDTGGTAPTQLIFYIDHSDSSGSLIQRYTFTARTDLDSSSAHFDSGDIVIKGSRGDQINIVGQSSTTSSTLLTSSLFKVAKRSSPQTLYQDAFMECQTKFLSADVTSNNTDIADLRFNNVDIGKPHSIIFSAYFNSLTTNTQSECWVYNGANPTRLATRRSFYASADASTRHTTASAIRYHTAVDDTYNVRCSIGSGSVRQGDETYVTLCQLPSGTILNSNRWD
jgi:hypothetical protein